MRRHLVQVAAVLFALGFGSVARADNYLITVSNVTLCASNEVCYGDVNGSFDYVATGVVGSSGPATSISLNLTPINGSTFSTSFDTFVTGKQFPSPNGSEIYFTNGAGDQFDIGLPFLPVLSGAVDESTTLACGAGDSACLAVFGSTGGIDFGANAGGTFTAVDLGSTQPPMPEPNTLALLCAALIGVASVRMCGRLRNKSALRLG